MNQSANRLWTLDRIFELFFNGVVTLIAILTFLLVREQSKELRRTNELAAKALYETRTNFIKGQQPYVWHGAIRPEPSGELLPDGRVTWRLEFQNYGTSAAVKFGHNARAH